MTAAVLKPLSLWTILAGRLRNIWAILINEIALQNSQRLGYAQVFIGPIAYIVGISVLRYELNPLHEPELGVSQPLFLLQGVAIFYAYSKAEAGCGRALKNKRTLLAFGSITHLDLYIALSLVATLNIIFVWMVIVVLHNFALQNWVPYMVSWPGDLLQVIVSLMAAGLFGLLIGMMNSSIEVWFPAWDKIFSIFRRAQIIMSGKMFVVDYMPTGMRNVLSWNPLCQLVEWIRVAFYPGFHSIVLDFKYLGICFVVAALLAFTMERYARSRMQLEAEPSGRGRKDEEESSDGF